MKQAPNGFTFVEVMVAVLVLTVGLLTLATTSALVTSMIGRGQRSSVAAAWTSRQMEQQRFRGCSSRFNGAADLFRGSTRLVRTSWTWTTVATSTYRATFITTYTTTAGIARSDTSETTVSCVL